MTYLTEDFEALAVRAGAVAPSSEDLLIAAEEELLALDDSLIDYDDPMIDLPPPPMLRELPVLDDEIIF